MASESMRAPNLRNDSLIGDDGRAKNRIKVLCVACTDPDN
jgi:hypothetical protein